MYCFFKCFYKYGIIDSSAQTADQTKKLKRTGLILTNLSPRINLPLSARCKFLKTS